MLNLFFNDSIKWIPSKGYVDLYNFAINIINVEITIFLFSNHENYFLFIVINVNNNFVKPYSSE
jgi:hypothetical protein